MNSFGIVLEIGFIPIGFSGPPEKHFILPSLHSPMNSADAFPSILFSFATLSAR
ncbi:MAG: hypothetical protein ABSF32_04005 [Ignavibacteria bacterium]